MWCIAASKLLGPRFDRELICVEFPRYFSYRSPPFNMLVSALALQNCWLLVVMQESLRVVLFPWCHFMI